MRSSGLCNSFPTVVMVKSARGGEIEMTSQEVGPLIFQVHGNQGKYENTQTSF